MDSRKANHPFFKTLSWGNAIPFKKGRLFIMAYKISGRYSYRDAALLLSDWVHGCNPMGRSLPTGVGINSPVRIISIALLFPINLDNRCVPPSHGIISFWMWGSPKFEEKEAKKLNIPIIIRLINKLNENSIEDDQIKHRERQSVGSITGD